MDRRVEAARLDPAVAVSGLLTRLALFLLVVLAPIIAMISRRAVAILVPIATALLILAATLDGHLPRAVERLRAIATSRQAYALIGLVLWAGATILWTPRPGEAAARLHQ